MLGANQLQCRPRHSDLEQSATIHPALNDSFRGQLIFPKPNLAILEHSIGLNKDSLSGLVAGYDVSNLEPAIVDRRQSAVVLFSGI